LNYPPSKVNPHLQHLKLLDCILNALKESGTHELTYDKLRQKTYQKFYSDSSLADVYSRRDEYGTAIIFLIDEGLIINRVAGRYDIRYPGIIKITNGGYVAEHKRFQRKIIADYFFQIVMPLITIISVTITVSKSC